MTWTPDRIKGLRTRLGWSQARLAAEMGIRQPTVSAWETGQSAPSPMACRLLDLLATTPPQPEQP